MTAGLQIFDGGGNIVWDTNMFICRSLGFVDITFGTGTVVDDRFTTGIPWAFPVLSGDGMNQPPGSVGYVNQHWYVTAPNIAISGNQLVWTRNGPVPYGWGTPDCRIYYGVR